MNRFLASLTAFAFLAIAAPAFAGHHTKSHHSKSGPDIVDTAVQAGTFKTLAAALGAADLVGALKGDGPFTVFAPTDEAFAKLPKATLESLLRPENKSQLAAILKYHVVSGNISSKQAVAAGSANTLEGSKVRFNIEDGRLRVSGANIVANDVRASNGVIHVIDKVLVPGKRPACH